MSNPFGLRAEVREWSRQCYGGYMNLCRQNGVKPVPYHEFADLIVLRYSTKQIFAILHGESK